MLGYFCTLPQTRTMVSCNHVSNSKLGFGWQRCKQTLTDLVYYLKKRMDIVRLHSLPVARKAIVKNSARSDAFGFDLDGLVLGGMVLLVKLFSQKSREFREEPCLDNETGRETRALYRRKRCHNEDFY